MLLEIKVSHQPIQTLQSKKGIYLSGNERLETKRTVPKHYTQADKFLSHRSESYQF